MKIPRRVWHMTPFWKLAVVIKRSSWFSCRTLPTSSIDNSCRHCKFLWDSVKSLQTVWKYEFCSRHALANFFNCSISIWKIPKDPILPILSVGWWIFLWIQWHAEQKSSHIHISTKILKHEWDLSIASLLYKTQRQDKRTTETKKAIKNINYLAGRYSQKQKKMKRSILIDAERSQFLRM